MYVDTDLNDDTVCAITAMRLLKKNKLQLAKVIVFFVSSTFPSNIT